MTTSHIDDDLLQRYLGDLHAAGLIQRTENDTWVMVRSLDSATLMEIYESGRYRLPLDAAVLEPFCEGLPAPLRVRLDELARMLRGELGTHLSDLFRIPDAEAGAGSEPGPGAATTETP